MSRVNLSGYVGHVTIFSCYFIHLLKAQHLHQSRAVTIAQKHHEQPGYDGGKGRQTTPITSRDIHYCVLFSSRVRVRFSIWLVSCYAHIFARL